MGNDWMIATMANEETGEIVSYSIFREDDRPMVLNRQVEVERRYLKHVFGKPVTVMAYKQIIRGERPWDKG